MAELKKKPIAYFSGYFDESGIALDSEVCVVAGFIGPAHAMQRIAKGWKRVLKKYGVQFFHSIQFYAPQQEIAESTTNPYKGWSKTKRITFIKELIAVLRQFNAPLHATAIDAVAFRSRTEEERRWMTGGLLNPMSLKKWHISGKPSAPYFYAFRSVVEGCVERIPDGKQIHLFMSEQNNYAGFAYQLYQIIRNSPRWPEFKAKLDEAITFAPHQRFCELQAADLAAYHLYQFGLRRRIDPKADLIGMERKVYFLRATASDLRFVDANAIEKECQKFHKRKAEAAGNIELRLTRLRAKVTHDPEQCEILGRVDAAGKYHRMVRNT